MSGITNIQEFADSWDHTPGIGDTKDHNHGLNDTKDHNHGINDPQDHDHGLNDIAGERRPDLNGARDQAFLIFRFADSSKEVFTFTAKYS